MKPLPRIAGLFYVYVILNEIHSHLQRRFYHKKSVEVNISLWVYRNVDRADFIIGGRESQYLFMGIDKDIHGKN